VFPLVFAGGNFFVFYCLVVRLAKCIPNFLDCEGMEL
jgi:hypothetical protein